MPRRTTDNLNAKTLTPAELRTREWDAVAAQIRERAFFMAGVTDAKTLAQFRAAAAAIAEGNMTPAEARKALRAALDAAGYTPEEGMEGGIKDLSSPRRMDATLRTNAEMAHGWAQRQTALGSVGYPGWELYRAGARMVPRDWDARWQEAAEAVGWQGVSRDTTRKVALVSSPIWARLSRFGQPHPPFDFNSGMDTKPVDFDTCAALGLMTEDAQPQMQDAAESLNADCAAALPQVDNDLRAQLEQALQGIAEWEGDTLRMVDANGTRSYAPEDIGRVLTTPNNAGTPLLQAEAAAAFAENPQDFGHAYIDSDQKQDFARLVERITPTPAEAGGQLTRALAFESAEAMAAVLEQLAGGEYAALPGTVAESWSADAAAAMEYAAGHDNIILTTSAYSSMVNVGPLYAALGMDSGLRLFKSSTRFNVAGEPTRRPNAQGGWDYFFTLAEIAR